MEKKVWNYMQEHNMTAEGTGVVAGVSGGADSLCLLLVLCRLAEEKKFRLSAVHVHHGLRGMEADRDEEAVRRICETLGVSLTVFHEDAAKEARERKMTVEEAGRFIRYERFAQEAERLGCRFVAVAHHQNDNAETVLFHLARGSSLRGLAGIPPVRQMGEITVIRPLLQVTRKEIEEYLKERKISYCMDSTNLDNDYTRNAIRNEILPLLEEKVNSRTAAHLGKTAEELAQIGEYLEEQAGHCLREGAVRKEDRIEFDRAYFLNCHPVLQRQMLAAAVEMLAESRKDITAGHLSQMRELFQKETGKRISLPWGLTAERNYEKVVLRLCRQGEGFQTESLSVPGEYSLPGGRRLRLSVQERKRGESIPKTSCIKWFDYDKINDMIFLRCPQPGDYYLFGPEGKRKNLNRYFIDRKVPRQERERQLLLTEGSHVIWILGDRTSEYYHVCDRTERVLTAELTEEETKEEGAPRHKGEENAPERQGGTEDGR